MKTTLSKITKFCQLSNASKALALVILCGFIASDSQSRSLLTSRTDLDSILQGIIDAENLRRPEDPIFDTAAHFADADIRTQAAQSLGRIGDISRAPLLIELLADQVPAVRSAAAEAAGYVVTQELSALLRDALQHENDLSVLTAVMLAVAKNAEATDQLSLLTAHERVASDAHVSEILLARSFEALSTLAARATRDWAVEANLLSTLSQGVNTFGSASEGDAARVGIAAAYGIGRYKGDPALIPTELVAIFNGITNPVVRGFLASALARSGQDDAKAALQSVFSEPHLRWSLVVDSVRALGLLPCDAANVAAYRNAYAYPVANLQPKIQVLETAAACGLNAHDLVDSVLNDYSVTPSVWLKQSALKALAAIGPQEGLPLARNVVDQDLVDELPAVGNLLVTSQLSEDATRLWSILSHRHGPAVAAVLDIATVTPEAQLPTDIKARAATLLQRGDLAITAGVASLIKEKHWSDLSGDLVRAFQASHADDVEVKVAILEALQTVGDATLEVFLRQAVGDPDHSVSLAAANALRDLTGIDLSQQVPAISRVIATTPSLAELRAAVSNQVRIETNRGVITIRMRDEAPLTAYNFIALVNRGFYDGLLFHRVVAHFVVQGGDPRGDGYGGPGYMIRDELSSIWHERGTLGMASAGKDTPGSQFFFNTRPNMHLNGNYTVFAEIIDGIDIADMLEQGDVMRHVSIMTR